MKYTEAPASDSTLAAGLAAIVSALSSGGSSNTLLLVAGETIGGDKLVMGDSGKVLKNDPIEANYQAALGFAINSAVLDADITVTIWGKHISAGWGLTPDAVYYATSDGGISDTPPTSGLSQIVGFALDSNTLYVDLQEPVILTIPS